MRKTVEGSSFSENLNKQKKAGSVATALVAGAFAIQSLLYPTQAVADDGTNFSKDFGEKYEKCGNNIKGKCAKISNEFTFIGDQKIDIDFFEKYKVIGNDGKITLIDNGYPVIIKKDGDANVKRAIFGEEVKKIYKDDNGKLVIENKNGENKYYIIEKIDDGMTSLKEYHKVKIEVNGIEADLDNIKKLDLDGKIGEIIDLDNSNGEFYELYYKGKKFEGMLDSNTKSIFLDKKGILHIKNKGDLGGKLYKIIDKGNYYTLEEKKIEFSYKK